MCCSVEKAPQVMDNEHRYGSFCHSLQGWVGIERNRYEQCFFSPTFLSLLTKSEAFKF